MMPWLKQLFAKWRTPDPGQVSPPKREPTEREEGMRLSDELKLYSDPYLKSEYAGVVHFTCISPNIIHLIGVLKEINATLRKESVISAQRCDFTEATVSVNGFFQKDNHYIPHGKILDYQKEIEVFYALTEACQQAEFGVHEHNYRMLTRVFVSLKNVNTALLEVLMESV